MTSDTHDDVGGPGEAPGDLIRDADVTRVEDDRGSGAPVDATTPMPDARDTQPRQHGQDMPGTGDAPGSHEPPAPETGETFAGDSRTT